MILQQAAVALYRPVPVFQQGRVSVAEAQSKASHLVLANLARL